MKSTHNSPRGQVLIIFVFSIIALVGIVGLAVDGGTIYADRRQAQNAADTAALAAAMARNAYFKANGVCTDTIDTAASLIPTCSGNTVNKAITMATTNGYPNNGSSISVQVYSPPKHGTYSDCTQPTVFDCHDYIEVVIADRVNTWFARVLGITELRNTVQAVAFAHYQPSTQYYNGMTLVQLATGTGACPSDFNVGGGGSITLNGGGIWVNSSNPSCAYKQTSCNTNVLGTGTISVVGGVDTNHCTGNQITPTTGVGPAYAYPPAHIFPAPPSKPPYCATHPFVSGVSEVVSGGAATYQPGDYAGQGAFPMYNGPATLQPGVYCVDRLVTNKDITGNGVFIYIYPTSNQSQVDMSGGVIHLTAITDSSNTYAGFLIYGDYDQNSKTNNPPTCTIAGGTNSVYTGMIWVPLCNLNVEGNTASSGESAQIIAAEISLGGTMSLNFTYDDSKYPKNPEQNKTGLYR